MDWKLALVQHPMFLIIKEDSQCAERTPPWGEPTVERYVDRVRENLAALRRYPQLKLGYEWSALELEMLLEEDPDAFRDLCALAREGRVAFHNGTYAQPHLQTLSSEANYRQFEHGVRVYREICGQRVLTYVHQEASVHDQVPQLLRAFGIRYATVPHFFSTLAWLDEGELAVRGDVALRFVHGSDLVRWVGLDRSEVVLYLRQPKGGRRIRDWWAEEAMAGELYAPPIAIETPDLITVDEQWLAEREQADFVLLDEALADRSAQHPPRARARLFAQWSYIEGMRAEELSRNNWRAEAAALQAEALNALAFTLLDRPVESADALWSKILGAQHHDVYCFSAPELRGKAVGWLQEAQREASDIAGRAARAIAAAVGGGEDGDRQLLLFHTVPHRQPELVTVDVPLADPALMDAEGEPVAAQVVALDGNSTRLSFLAASGGLGYATYRLSKGGRVALEREVDQPLTFENAFYRAQVLPDATFASLALQPTGEELLQAGAVRGNQLAGTDSTGLSPRHDGWLADQDWQPPQRGPELCWEPAARAWAIESSLGLTLTAPGRLAAGIRADLTVRFYHDLPRIDLRWELAFAEPTSIGTFYDDETKLRIQWPLAFAGDIFHDIPFGVVKAREGRPLLPASWIDASDGHKGLAYFHQGTPKHWVKEWMLVNLFAWGEDTNAIGSRVWRRNWPKAFDQRLRGAHTIEAALYPHAGDWRAANLVGAARAFAARPLALVVDGHHGPLPARLNLLALTDPGLAATAVTVEGPQVLCRVYAAGQSATAGTVMQHLQGPEMRSLAGEAVEYLSPYQIGQIVFEPQRNV